ncbi:MAG: uroporphyrinogen-III synthase [Pseudomonadota bacterium]
MVEPVLVGGGVLVTRPEHQAGPLLDAIQAAGGRPYSLPTIEIVPRDDNDVVADAALLGSPDITVFISSNAVRLGIGYTSGARIAAVGPSTANAIRAAGYDVDIVSESGFDSEHLLATPAFANVDGQTVRIVRGQTGRELLGDTLRERGAIVDYLAVYTRQKPKLSTEMLTKMANLWSADDIDAVIALSVETLTNLIDLIPDDAQQKLATTPLVTHAERVIIAASERFPDMPVVRATSPHPDDLVSALASIRN